MAKILVVDDEFRIRQIIRKYAEFEGYEVEEAVDGMQAIEICRKKEFDLIIMDVMMPELDGFSACREIRKFRDTPIIMLSARGEEYDKIHGFELGSDDYVVKPFSPKELMMRVGAVIKRSGSTDQKSGKRDVFTYKGLEVDFTARIVTIDGKRVEMTPKEYELFFYMVRNKGIALTRESLISEVWGYDFFGDERTLDTHIKLLRKSLGEYSKCIVTLRGVGYRFETDEEL
ncbi:MAG: response regulator transcription factor [Ruminococcus sp.]|nr:response regulator transcription factor [Ruminococcus sp.]